MRIVFSQLDVVHANLTRFGPMHSEEGISSIVYPSARVNFDEVPMHFPLKSVSLCIYAQKALYSALLFVKAHDEEPFENIGRVFQRYYGGKIDFTNRIEVEGYILDEHGKPMITVKNGDLTRLLGLGCLGAQTIRLDTFGDFKLQMRHLQDAGNLLINSCYATMKEKGHIREIPRYELCMKP